MFATTVSKLCDLPCPGDVVDKKTSSEATGSEGGGAPSSPRRWALSVAAVGAGRAVDGGGVEGLLSFREVFPKVR